jgi:hypothetical protein
MMVLFDKEDVGVLTGAMTAKSLFSTTPQSPSDPSAR